MAELSVIAAKTLPAFTLMPEDIPAAAGFVYFDAPIAALEKKLQDMLTMWCASTGLVTHQPDPNLVILIDEATRTDFEKRRAELSGTLFSEAHVRAALGETDDDSEKGSAA